MYLEEKKAVSSTRKVSHYKLHYETLHEIFEEQADAWPEGVAVLMDGKEITYYELEQRANRLARHLRTMGLKHGSLAAILLHRSVEAYVAILAVLKAGAAYVPLDPEYPADRTSFILKDAGVSALITIDDLARRHETFRGITVRVDIDCKAIEAESATRLPKEFVNVSPNDLCYVIYTSGSTGRPKGVQIEHKSACNLVLGEGEIFKVRQTDRVCQAASLSFDLSVEEIWLAFHVGATLVPAGHGITRAGPDFSRFLNDNHITVLSCVPTLLFTIEEKEVSDLRLIILGGETCPEWIVARWTRSGLRIVNTYGPTETTVIATYTDLEVGRPVTIGRPAPGYRVYVLNDSLQHVPPGTTGQICIGGTGVARGYVGLDRETRTRFVPDPYAPSDDVNAQMYLTGDLGRFDSEGNLEFLGRADGQVKLRGFRIELSEIESVMMQYEDVLAAACTVREDMQDIQQLVGYVIARNGRVDVNGLRSHLRDRLPAFMIPSLIEIIKEIPRLPSGKLDRASLPAPQERYDKLQSAKLPRNDIERQIANVWQALFQPQVVSIGDNFFLDLGGHSLLAARMVSELRKDARFAHVSISDVYEHPTIESLASVFDVMPSHPQRLHQIKSKTIPEDIRPSKLEQNLVKIIQVTSLYHVFGFRAVEWMTPYLVFFFLLAHNYSILGAITWSAISAIAVFPLLLAIAIASKWVILGRMRPGRYPLWGRYHLRWWFVQTLVSSLPLDYLAGTPILPFIYRLFGAKIGKDVYLGTNNIASFDLTTIGNGTSIDDDSSLLGYTVEDGMLILGHVSIGSRCYVGSRSVLRENTVMEDRARLEDLSLLPRGFCIPQGESWAGSPAKCTSYSKDIQAPPELGKIHRAVISIVYGTLVLLFPLLLLVAVLPGVVFLVSINPVTQPFLYIPSVMAVGGSFVVFLAGEVLLFKWLVVGRVRVGKYRVHGSYYIRNWIVEQLLAFCLDLIAPLHATLYLAPWYRLLGAKIGRNVELSTASSATPDLIEIEDESTIADEASLGSPHIEGGWMTIASTHLGKRTFIGNSAVVPADTVMGNKTLLGVLSLAPKSADASKGERSWLGSPPILLPRREKSCSFSQERTFQPPRKLRLTRGSIEIFRVTLPAAGFVLVATAVLDSIINISHLLGLGTALLFLPIVYGLSCVTVIFIVALAKWIIMGRFRPFTHPLWSTFIWRLEFVNALYEFLATPLALEILKGTPILPWYFRLLGARVGHDVYADTTGLLEFDLVDIGDRAVLNEDCVLQTHLFEDRVLKASKVQIGKECNVGATSVVLYDSKMEDRSQLDALSLLMKGERLPEGTKWAGLPAKRSYD